MTRITHTQIEVTKNPLLKVPIVVPQWEAHVVLALWGDDANVTGTVVIDRDVPEVNDEFTRLANKYGPRDEDIPFVARVYGGFGPGLRALANEFQVSVAGSNIPSQASQVSEVALETAAPKTLAGFDGSAAPTAPDLELDETDKASGPSIADLEDQIKAIQEQDAVVSLELDERTEPSQLSEAEIDKIDNVDSLAGNTIEGKPMVEFMNDVSDLTGDMETTDKAE